MLKNASFLAIVAVDTEENEPLTIWGDLFSYSVHSLVTIHIGLREAGGGNPGTEDDRSRAQEHARDQVPMHRRRLQYLRGPCQREEG